MFFLKCPGCGAMEPVEPERVPLDNEHDVLVFNGVETFVGNHLTHLAEDALFDVIESAGDC